MLTRDVLLELSEADYAVLARVTTGAALHTLLEAVFARAAEEDAHRLKHTPKQYKQVIHVQARGWDE